MSRFHRWTVPMVKDLLERQKAGADPDELLRYAQEVYGFKSTVGAIKTALTRYSAGMYRVVSDGSEKITWVNRLPKERDSRYGGLSDECVEFLRKARAAAIRAVAVYNTPTLDEEEDFRSANYIVLMIIAWTALFHALFLKRNVQPYYSREAQGGAGQGPTPRMWELRECLRRYFGEENPPERANLCFLAGLRDRIEHRHLPALDEEIFGECQACLTNFERLLVREFGDQFALNARLAFALQFGENLQPSQVQAIRDSQRKRAADALRFIEEFRGRLPDQLLASQRFAFRVYMVPKGGGRPKSSDAAVEFVRFDPDNPDQMEKYRKLTLLIRDRHVPIANLGMLKPGQVVQQVAPKIRWKFNINRHTRCWKHYQVRPPSGAADPKVTKQQYCVWDDAHHDYLYTPAWVRFLIKKLQDPNEYRRAVGIDPLIEGSAPTQLQPAQPASEEG